jgi:hypothetical protein
MESEFANRQNMHLTPLADSAYEAIWNAMNTVLLSPAPPPGKPPGGPPLFAFLKNTPAAGDVLSLVYRTPIAP